MNKSIPAVAAAAVATALAGCAAFVARPDPQREAQQIIQASFVARGQAQLDRLQQDDANRACSQAQGQPLPDARRAAATDGRPPRPVVVPDLRGVCQDGQPPVRDGSYRVPPVW